MRILLADDSVTAQNMGKKILAEAGHEVICVSNGAAALKKVGEQAPELVILDIYMPGYSGLEVCQRLKENPGTASLPVVLTVGKLEPFRKEDAQRARAEALIVKPFEASELQAAVARFAEIAASAPQKPRSKAKLGPQAQAQPEQFSPEDFVTASQQEGQKEEKPEATPAVPVEETRTAAAVRLEAPTEPVPAAASEFEVTAEAGGSGTTSVAATGAETAETTWPAGANAEFSVRAEEPISPPNEAEVQPANTKAAAAVAGADFGAAGAAPPSSGATAEQDFVVPAPSGPGIPQASALTAPIAGEAPSLPGVPEFSSPAAPGFQAARQEPAEMPGTDPAFDPDRTQWATQFATRFGVAEEAPAEPAEPAEGAEPELPVASTSPEEIAAILSNLPGGMANNPQLEPVEEGEQSAPRPWPLQSSVPAEDNWKAEEVPVEDGDSSVSLADEMEKAFEQAHGAPSNFSEVEALPKGEEANSPALEAPAEQPSPTPVNEAVQSPFEEGRAEFSQVIDANSVPSPPAPEVKESPAPDRVAGVMQSAAMAIATRATISAVASQLHAQEPAENATTGPSAIEELVGQVLERLKPKLIAEIKRELKTPDEK